MQITVDEDLKRVFKQIHQLEKQLLDGNVQPLEVRKPLQDILEHKFDCSWTQQLFWYISPEEQLANMRRWNEERGWGFSDSDFPAEIPDFTPSAPLEVLVLVVYLPDEGKGRKQVPGYVRTANELWQITHEGQPNWWQWDELKLDSDHLRLLPEVSHTPGIRWVALDLGAHWNAKDGVRPCDVRGEDSAHAEILAAAAHFPQWIQNMDGEKVLFVWLSGYQVTIPGRGVWADLPILYCLGHDRKVYLSADWDNDRSWYYAVPVVREL
jgi:hypothetical protein